MHTMTSESYASHNETQLIATLAIHNLGGTAEVAQVLECPKQQVHSLRRNPKFPQPVRELAATPLWRISEVLIFKETWKRRGPRKTKASALDTIVRGRPE